MTLSKNKGRTFFLALAVILFFPLILHAQINHSPVITSSPPTTLIAGEQYSYLIKASDADNDKLIFTLSSSPANTKIDQNGLITWSETKTGLYNVIIEVSDQKGGYTSQAFQIKVNPSSLNTIIITPNNRPTIVVAGRTITFQAKDYDAYNNEISDITFMWSTDEKIGIIDQNGLFTAKHGGIGFVAAEKDNIKASVGVVVKDATSVVNANITNAKPEEEKPKEQPKQEIITKEEEPLTTETAETAEITEKKEEAKEQPAVCKNWPNWLIILVLVIYGIILSIYYLFIKKYRAQRVRGWWIIPLFLTAMGEIIYFRYFCKNTYLWWPWVLLGIGIVITAYYFWRTRKKDYTQSELPF